MSLRRGPALVLATAVLLTLATGWLLWPGLDEANLHAVLRLTARSAFGFFLATFIARPLGAVGTPALRALHAHRKHLGLAFATAMGFHLATLITLWLHGERFPAPIVLGGSVGLAFVAALTVTSFPAPTRALGGARWRALHSTGMWVFFGIFTFDYLPVPGAHPVRLAAFAALLAALSLRVFARVRRRVQVQS